MMNQLTVSYQEIENRLAICCEFLLNRKKSIEDAYESLMEKLGTKLMEYSEFEYWFKRFQNDQFDLAYDTILDSKEISEIQNTMDPEANGVQDDTAVIIEEKTPLKIVERNMEDLKYDHQFKEENVPETFQTLFNSQSIKVIGIEVGFREQCCTAGFGEMRIRMKKKRKNWMIRYKHTDERFKTDAPEESIIDHLWFVLRNPSIKLEDFRIHDNRNPELKLKNQKFDFGKLNTLLQWIFNAFDHQIQTSRLICDRFNEETFFSLLKHVEPGTLEVINFEISSKQEGNYQKMKEIVETDQWKQAKEISSTGITTLKVEDFFHCEYFRLGIDRITSEDVLRVTEHYFNSVGRKFCHLSSKNENIDIEAIVDALRSQNDGSKITETKPISSQEKFSFKIVKSVKFVVLKGSENFIRIQNYL